MGLLDIDNNIGTDLPAEVFKYTDFERFADMCKLPLECRMYRYFRRWAVMSPANRYVAYLIFTRRPDAGPTYVRCVNMVSFSHGHEFRSFLDRYFGPDTDYELLEKVLKAALAGSDQLLPSAGFIELVNQYYEVFGTGSK